ncbi:MAG TPA: gamma-glutamyltransferase, partial [Candidatus Binataceae bacterium]|nr:gamma-glutamyltransferase [Candidatus Binataceae bacterium]
MLSYLLFRNQKPEVDVSPWPAIIILAATLLLGAPPHSARAATAPHAMIAAEGDLAAQAGLDVLKRGGNAVDAAVAISLVLGVTNSGSCGIGGGGFMLIYRAQDHKVYALDYREV